MWKFPSAVLAILVLGIAALPAAVAQSPAEPLETRLVARKVVVVDGRETLVEAASARPGDVIEYTATYRNTGKDAITGLQATLPIPRQTEFVPGTARPARAMASLDGSTFADDPAQAHGDARRQAGRGTGALPRVPRDLRWFAGELAGGKSLAVHGARPGRRRPAPNEPGGPGGGR